LSSHPQSPLPPHDEAELREFVHEINTRIVTHEAICAERYKNIELLLKTTARLVFWGLIGLGLVLVSDEKAKLLLQVLLQGTK